MRLEETRRVKKKRGGGGVRVIDKVEMRRSKQSLHLPSRRGRGKGGGEGERRGIIWGRGGRGKG